MAAREGKFLSNALCPSNGADINGPTANVNSVGKVLGGRAADGQGDWDDYLNLLPNGGSHTMTFNPSILRDAEHRDKFKAFLRGYIENGGSALQINMIDADMLRDAQKHPENYRHLLVRVTGYNAYFTSHRARAAERDHRPGKPPDVMTDRTDPPPPAPFHRGRPGHPHDRLLQGLPAGMRLVPQPGEHSPAFADPVAYRPLPGVRHLP